MKLTKGQKIQIYHEWKTEHKSPYTIAGEWRLSRSNVEYIVHLADLHGEKALAHKWTYYSPEYKEKAIKRVLIGHESMQAVSLQLGLSARGTLPRWVEEFTSNGYNIIERKRGRHVKEGEDAQGAAGGERGAVKAEQRASQAELDTYHTERIRKKIEGLSFGKRKARRQGLAQAVTELRQELKCSAGFVLEAIRECPSLPQISRADYYYWKDRKDPDWKNDELMNEIISRYYEHKGRYGYRRLTLYLRRDGWVVNHKTIKRLMKRMGLYGCTPKAKYKSYKGDLNGTVRNRLLLKETDEDGRVSYKRDFSTTGSDQKWATDVTEFHVAAGRLYLSPIMDMYDHEIVSYSISSRPDYRQVQDMLDRALSGYRNLKGLIFHSDQGWQYQMPQYHKVLQDRGIIQSMSRKGNCLDNCIMENFFGKLKNEMFYGYENQFQSLDQLQDAIEEYIDYYNHQRIQVRLKGLTPCEARIQALALN